MSDYFRYMSKEEFSAIEGATARRHGWYSDDHPDEDGYVRIIAGQDAQIDALETSVANLRHALALAQGLFHCLGVDVGEWEDSEGVSAAAEWAEFVAACSAAEQPYPYSTETP